MDAKSIKAIAAAWQEVIDEKAKKQLDPVDKDELDGTHDDRDDKDIDNDGDVDSSDKFLHKKRKAIGKAMKKDKSMDEDADEMTPCPDCDGSSENHDPDCPRAEASEKKKAQEEDLDAKEVGKALSHDCAKHVASESWGFGECIKGEHTLVESADGEGVVSHYDVMFEHGLEQNVPVEELTILLSEKHLHASKKVKEDVEIEEKKGLYHNINMKKKRGEEPNPKGHPDRPSDDDFKQSAKTAKEGVEEGTVAELDQEVESTYKGKGDSLYDAIQQVWEAAAQAKQGVAGKYQEKQKGDPQRHGQSQKMISDTDYDNPELVADDEKGHEDASKAGRVVTKQSPARGSADQLQVGDKKPVK